MLTLLRAVDDATDAYPKASSLLLKNCRARTLRLLKSHTMINVVPKKLALSHTPGPLKTTLGRLHMVLSLTRGRLWA